MSVIYAKRAKVLWYISLQKYIFNVEYRKKITQKCKKQRERCQITQKCNRWYFYKKYFCHINQETKSIMEKQIATFKDYAIFMADKTSLLEIAQFVVKENYSHHLSSFTEEEILWREKRMFY